jgi:hypothetical protein
VRRTAILLATLVLVGSAARADVTAPSPKCLAPLKQSGFATQFEVDRYKAVVDLYRSCLEAFVKEQEQAIATHRAAIQQAIDEWNRFVGKEKK